MTVTQKLSEQNDGRNLDFDSGIELLLCFMLGSCLASGLPTMCNNFSRGLRQFDFGWFFLLGAESILIHSDVEWMLDKQGVVYADLPVKYLLFQVAIGFLLVF